MPAGKPFQLDKLRCVNVAANENLPQLSFNLKLNVVAQKSIGVCEIGKIC